MYSLASESPDSPSRPDFFENFNNLGDGHGVEVGGLRPDHSSAISSFSDFTSGTLEVLASSSTRILVLIRRMPSES